jgi:hypothetical protein
MLSGSDRKKVGNSSQNFLLLLYGYMNTIICIDTSYTLIFLRASAKKRERMVELYIHSPVRLHSVVLKHKDNFTYYYYYYNYIIHMFVC